MAVVTPLDVEIWRTLRSEFSKSALFDHDVAICAAINALSESDWRDSVLAKTLAGDLPLAGSTYNDVTKRVTANANGAFPVIDGIAIPLSTVGLGPRGFLYAHDGVADLRFGPYVVIDAGSGATPWIIERRADTFTPAEITTDTGYPIEQGTQAPSRWYCGTTGAIVLGTTPIQFFEFAPDLGAAAPSPLAVAAAAPGTSLRASHEDHVHEGVLSVGEMRASSVLPGPTLNCTVERVAPGAAGNSFAIECVNGGGGGAVALVGAVYTIDITAGVTTGATVEANINATGTIRVRVPGGQGVLAAGDAFVLQGFVGGVTAVTGFESGVDKALIDTLAQANLTATTVPGAFDDTNAGYSVGSAWFIPASSRLFVCTSAAAGAATWRLLNVPVLGVVPGAGQDSTQGYSVGSLVVGSDTRLYEATGVAPGAATWVSFALTSDLTAATAPSVSGVQATLALPGNFAPIVVRAVAAGTAPLTVSAAATGGAGTFPTATDGAGTVAIVYEDGGALSTPANIAAAIGIGSALLEVSVGTLDNTTLLAAADAFAATPLAGGVAAFTGTFTGAEKAQVTGVAASRSKGFYVAAPLASGAALIHAAWGGDAVDAHMTGNFLAIPTPRNATMTFTALWPGGTDIIARGLDQFGNEQTETFLGAGGATVVGAAVWSIIFAAERTGPAAAPGDQVSIGTGNKIGMTDLLADTFGVCLVDDVVDAIAPAAVDQANSGVTPTTLPNGARNYKFIVNVQV